MPTARRYTTETPATETGFGTNGSGDLKILFPGSPMYDGTYTDAKVRETFSELVLSAIVNDGGHTFGEVNRDYADSPNLAEVQTGGGGLPGTPYSPNIAAPAVGSGLNPTTIPAAGAAVTARQPNSKTAVGSQSPHETSIKISSQNSTRIGDLIFGAAYRR